MARRLRVGGRLYEISRQVDPPGVVNGVLEDPQTYFFWLIQRAPDQPADDWAQVLTDSGIPAGYPPYVIPTDNGYYGLTQQIRSGGEVAGRIFLPTGVPDELGYYSHPVSPLKDAAQPGHLLWEWRPLGGPPYVPVDTDGGSIPVPPDNTEQRLETLEAQVANHEGRITTLEQRPTSGIQIGDKIALRTNSGLIAGIKGGGPTVENQPIDFLGKTEIHAWESFTLEKGE